jgi:hypothetical protein
MRRYTASVTFEYDTEAPQTWRGEVASDEPSTAASRAVKACQNANPGARWRSAVVVLEKRPDEATR